MNYIKTTISADGYQEVSKLGSKYVVRINPQIDGDAVTCIECIECMVDAEPSEADIEAIKAEYVIQMLPLVKAEKVAEIDAYDVSSAVNAFEYQGKNYWLDKATRNGLRQSTADEMAVGRTETTLILGDTRVVLPCETVVQMLVQLEVYAKDCYDATAGHKMAVNALTTIEAVQGYDYTSGYPEKIVW